MTIRGNVCQVPAMRLTDSKTNIWQSDNETLARTNFQITTDRETLSLSLQSFRSGQMAHLTSGTASQLLWNLLRVTYTKTLTRYRKHQRWFKCSRWPINLQLRAQAKIYVVISYTSQKTKMQLGCFQLSKITPNQLPDTSSSRTVRGLNRFQETLCWFLQRQWATTGIVRADSCTAPSRHLQCVPTTTHTFLNYFFEATRNESFFRSGIHPIFTLHPSEIIFA